METRIEIQQYIPALQPEWDYFIANSRNGTFLFFRNYMDYHSDRFIDNSLLFRYKGKLIAVLPANREGDVLWSHQGLTYGGLVLSSKCTADRVLNIFSLLFSWLSERGFSKLVYKCVPDIYHRYPSQEDLYALFRNNARLVARNLSTTVSIPCRIPFSQLRRRGIKRALSCGIVVQESSDLESFWRVLSENLSDRYNRLPVHTVEEMSMLADYIGSLDGEIRIVMESTGHYHLPVAQFLYQKGFFVCVENAYIIRQFSRIMLHGAKTDPLDAKKLAKYGLAYWSELKPYKFHPSCYTELSLLSKQYQTYIKLLIAAKQNVIHLMDEMLPGFKEALDTASSVQFSKVKYVDFAKEFYHVDMIKSMGKEIFRENYKQWCKEKGYRFQSEKADELFHLAEDGIPTLPTEFPSTRLCMEVATEQVSQLGYALEQILSQMQNLAKTLPEYQTIRQMGGMGEKLCVRFIADIGDVRRFHNGKALVAYAGIDAPPYQSGQYTGTKRRISKRGNSALRKTGYEVMKSLKSHPPKTDTRVYDFIIKKENEGKSRKQAKIAGLNKFLQIYYARVMEIYKNIV